MAESSYDKIAEIADYLKLSISAEEIAGCFTKLNMNQEEIDKTVEFFEILEERKKEAVVNTCLKLSVEHQIKCTKKIKLNAKRNNVKFHSIQII